MEEFIFKNLDSKVDITIPLNKNITYIYGGNGRGKTTFSRFFSEMQNIKARVFNLDFINKNVYVIDQRGAKLDTNTKEGFSKLFVSDKAVEHASNMSKLKEIQKEVEKMKDIALQKFNSTLENIKVTHISTFDSLKKLVKVKESIFNWENTIDENSKVDFIDESSISSNILSDNELIIKAKQFSSDEELKIINKLLNENEQIKSIFIEKNMLTNINILLTEYNLLKKSIAEQEYVFKKHGKPSDIKPWVEEALKIHLGKTDCILCDSKNITAQLNKWKNIIEDKVLEKKAEVLRYVKQVLKNLNEHFLNSEQTLSLFIPKIIETSKKICTYLKDIDEKVSKTEEVKIIEIPILIDDIAATANTIHSEIVGYLINKDIKAILFPTVFFDYLVAIFSSEEVAANKESDKFKELTSEAIKKVGNILGLEKEIGIVLDTRGSTPKLSIDSKTKITTFSEGQRHKLALVIFFANILIKKEKLDYLVLDDPIISLDVVTYHKLKSFLVYNMKDYYNKMVLLTHNLSFLLIMISNIFRDSALYKQTQLLELNPKECKEISLDIIAKNDIILLKNAIINSDNINDITLWYWLLEKVLRYFVDIKLSVLGKVSFDDFGKDIEKIFGGDQLEEAKQCHNIVQKTSKSNNSTIDDILKALNNVNKFMDFLKFPRIIDQSEIDYIGEKFPRTAKVLSNPKAKNFEFQILLEGFNLHFDTSKEKTFLRSYMNHPRHQITHSLVAFATQQDY